MTAQRIGGHLVCGGKYHDIDFARLEILKTLADHAGIRVTVDSDYRNIGALERADFLVTYTCEVLPGEVELEALDTFIKSGKRWLALHGTNSVLRYRKGAGWEAPDDAPAFMQMLGSQFVAHPPIAPYTVRVQDSDHPLVAGITDFEVEDELYLCDMQPDIEVLLATDWSGPTPGFVRNDWSDGAPRPILYLRRWGDGEILYFTLGHARGRFDMQPLVEEYPHTERGSWPNSQFRKILDRGIRWAAGQL